MGTSGERTFVGWCVQTLPAKPVQANVLIRIIS
jgi:hypothetical protein